MINFRYHIVSLTAVFLALAVGLAMGTTFLNQATVDQLKHDIGRAEDRIDDTNATNQELRDDVGRYQAADAALVEATPELLAGKLTDVRVLVVASDGIDQPSLDDVRTALTDAGADLRGTLRIADRLRSDGGHDEDLATALAAEPSTERNVLQVQAATEIAGALDAAADRKASSQAEQPAVIGRLLDAGFLRYEAPDDEHDVTSALQGGAYRYVFVSGSDPKVPDDELLLPVLTRMSEDGPAPVVLASAATGDDPESTRNLVVGPVRNDEDLSSAVSTVDDLEHFWGLLATVLAVRDLDAGIRDHWGTGDGVKGLFPTTP